MVSLRAFVTAAVLPLASALTAQEIVNNINTLTTKSKALQEPARTITILNAPLIVIGQGPFPQLIAGFTDIVVTATTANAAMNADRDRITSVSDAKLIADAFRTFVRVHQELLNILIGKAGLVTSLPIVGPPVAAVLRSLEAIVDTIAFGLIDIIDPSDQKADLTSDYKSLDASITLTINKYDGLQLRKTKRDFVA
ncbi:hypothetical protein V8F20_001363 [Naviculisporaceae sp. PSN 640]